MHWSKHSLGLVIAGKSFPKRNLEVVDIFMGIRILILEVCLMIHLCCICLNSYPLAYVSVENVGYTVEYNDGNKDRP